MYLSIESKSTSTAKWKRGKYVYIYIYIYIYKIIHSLSSKIVFSLNSFFHFVFLGRNKKHFIQYFVFFIPT